MVRIHAHMGVKGERKKAKKKKLLNDKEQLRVWQSYSVKQLK